MKYILAGVLLIGACAFSDADCVVRARVVQAHVVQAVVQPVAIATYVPYAVTVPTYAIGYRQEDVELREAVKELVKSNQLMAQQLQAMRGQGAAAPEQPKHVAIMQQRCASCHEKTVSQAKGGGFTLLDGASLSPSLSLLDVMKVTSHAYSGTMPKGGPKLDDSEVGEIMAWVGSLTASKK